MVTRIDSRAGFDCWERFASSRRAAALMFAWAVGEATVWPIIPDSLLVPMAVGNRRRFGVSLAASALGMALGGVATFLFARRAPSTAASILQRLPLVSDRDIEAARRHLLETGIPAFLFQPWSGIPFKVWGVQAGVQRLNPVLVVPTFVFARTLRMAVFATAAALLARRFTAFVRDHFIVLLAIYAALFVYGMWRLARRS